MLRHRAPLCLLLVVAGALPSGAPWAALTELIAFDTRHCRLWRLGDWLDSPQNPVPAPLQRLLDDAQRAAGARDMQSSVLVGDVYVPPRDTSAPADALGTVHCIVSAPAPDAGRRFYPVTLQCFVSMGSAIERYEYRARRDPNSTVPVTYRCFGDCFAYPVRAVYEMAYEDGPENPHVHRAGHAYARRCPR